MAEPIRTDLKLVDENYTAPADASAADKAKAVKAAAIREGIRRHKLTVASERKAEAAAHQANVEGVKSAHVDELKRRDRIVAKASYHQGVTHVSFIWMVIAAAALFTGAWLQTSGFAMRVADERLPRPGDGVPELVDREQRAIPYERNGREPPSAP